MTLTDAVLEAVRPFLPHPGSLVGREVILSQHQREQPVRDAIRVAIRDNLETRGHMVKIAASIAQTYPDNLIDEQLAEKIAAQAATLLAAVDAQAVPKTVRVGQ